MTSLSQIDSPQSALRMYRLRELLNLPQVKALGRERLFEMQVVGAVLPVQANSYVINELIDWEAGPEDPMFNLVFPRREMLDDASFTLVANALLREDPEVLRRTVAKVRGRLNPHPAGQTSLNRPFEDDTLLEGVQHKYAETLLYFPSEGQTCHTYCTFCFRWPQFTGNKETRIAVSEHEAVQRYIKEHPEISDVLITGGDPFIMKSRRLSVLFDALTQPGMDHVRNVRIGTKALSWWPRRFISDPDADELLAALSKLTRRGKHVAIMAHFNHWRELVPATVGEAIVRLKQTGAVIRSQSPLLRRINDDSNVWSTMWAKQVRLGIIPYYMFVARDTGAQSCFDVPLAEAWRIYAKAAQGVGGLGRTARGPAMSAAPGKVEIAGVAEVGGERVFVLRFIQGRVAEWAYRPFFAAYDESSTWFDELKPAFGAQEFFFEPEFRELQDKWSNAVHAQTER